MNITKKDNAWHASIFPQYIEWWYCDALFASNYSLAGSFAIWGNLRRPTSLTIRSDFLLTAPDGTVINFDQDYQISGFRASSKKCDVHLGLNSLVDRKGDFLLYLENRNGASLQLVFIPQCSGFKHIHYFDYDKGQFFAWLVPAPRATVWGNLTCRGKQTRMEGIGYHDHNWASVSLSQRLSGWKWARFHAEDITLILASVEGVRHPLFSGMAWIEKGTQLFDYRHIHFGPQCKEITFTEKCIRLIQNTRNLNVDLYLEMNNAHSLIDKSQATGYKRLISQANGSIHDGQSERHLSGLLLHEIKTLKTQP